MLLKVYKSRVWVLLMLLLPFLGAAQIPGLPAGWGFTQNPTSEVIAVPTTVTFDGIASLQANDWIGVFFDASGTLKCGGAVQWTGTGNVAVVAFGNDALNPVKNGFDASELIKWKIYRTATSMEVCAKAYDAANAEFLWVDGTYPAVAKFTNTPIVNCPTYATPFCVNAAAFALSGATPVGGTYTGPGVSGGTFTPSVAGVGLHTITYTYTNTYGCSGSCSFTINVVALPVVTCPANMTGIKTTDAPFTLTGGSPVGGVYTGTGVSGGVFSPAVAGVGTWTITYTYTNANGCSNFCNFTIQVILVPVSVTQTINYVTGWNWLSFNVLPVNPTVRNTLAGFTPQNGDVLKNQTQQFIFNGTVWNPNLVIDPDKAYLLKTAKPAGSFVVTNTDGNYVQVNDPITINAAGWTWIGYKPRVQHTPAQAFISMAGTFTNGDIIKTQTTQALYFSATGLWQPPTFKLNPGVGYKFKYQRTPGNTLTYPLSDGLSGGSNSTLIAPITPKAMAGAPDWQITPGMETNMGVYVTAALLLGVPVQTGLVAAFKTSNNQCRALEEFWDGGEGAGQVILTVGFDSEEGGSTFYYKVWDSSTDIVYEVTETGVMVSDDFITLDLHLIPQIIPVSISGTVTNSVTLAPIAGVQVSALSGTPPTYGPPTWAITPGMETNMGVYVTSATLAGVPVQTGLVAAFKTSNNQCRALEEFWDGGEGAGQVILTVGFDSEEGGSTFYYKVWNSENNIVYDVTQTGVMISDDFQITDLTMVGLPAPVVINTTTGADGKYIFNNIADGTYTVKTGNSIPTVGYTDQTAPGTYTTPPSKVVNFALVPFNQCENPPTAFAGADDAICAGNAYTLAGATATNYTALAWTTTGTGLFDDASLLNPTYTPGAGDVSVTLTLTASKAGCPDAVDAMVLTINPLPTFDCPTYGPYCAGDPAVVFAGPGVYTNVDFVQVTGFDPVSFGSYTFHYTVTENGCSASCTFVILVNALPIATCPQIAPVCEGSAYINFPTVSGGVYTQNGNVVAGFNPAAAGSYGFVLTVINANDCVASCQFSIVVNALPIATCPQIAPVCEGSEYIIFPTVVGGVYTQNGETVTGFNPAVAGTHGFVLTVTNEFGCVASCQFSIVVIPATTVNAGPDAAICADFSPYQLNGSVTNAVSYMWYTTNGLGSFSNDGILNPMYYPSPFDYLSGSVDLYLAAASGTSCPNVFDGMTLTFNALPEVICPAIAPVCEGSAFINFPAVSGGVYTQNGNVVTGFNPSVAGSYGFVLTVTNANNCVASCQFSILVNPLPVVTCPGNMNKVLTELPYTLEGAMPLGGTYSGEGVVDGVFFVEVEGDYTITYTYTNENGCVSSCTFIITVGEVECPNPPTANAGLDAGVCAGNSFMLAGATATNYTVLSWTTSGTGLFDNASLLHPTYTPGAGDVSVTLTLTASKAGCPEAMDAMVLTINPLPTASCPPIAPVCEGSAYINFPVVAGGVYTQNGNVVTGFNPAIAGSYGFVLTVTSEFGCVASCEFSIIVNPAPVASCPQIAPVCEGSAYIDFPVVAGGVYTQNGNVVNGFNPAIAGSYGFVLTVTNEFGCVASCQFSIVVNPMPELTEVSLVVTEDGTLWLPFEGTLDGGYTLCINPASSGYALNIASLVSTEALSIGYNGFFVSTYPADYFAYWNNRGVNAGAVAGTWQAWMWQIINGNEPIFYIQNNGTDYMLVDGLKKDFAGQITYLVLPGNYPAGDYTFTGQVQSAAGCSSELITVGMTFNSFPVIAQQPVDASVLYGGVAVFSVTAQYANGYQWYGPSGMMAGEVGTSLTLVGVTPANQGAYYVAVTNDCGTVNSNVANLVVNPLTQIINLPVKLNGVSTYLDLFDNSVANNVAPLGANLQYFSFMRPDQTFVPGGIPFAWTEERGAKISLKTTWPTSISVTGYPTLGTLVTMPSGNSLLPVWSQGVVSAADVFGPLGANLILVQGITEAGKAYWPTKGIFTLQNLVPGRAYLISLVAGGTVSFDVPIVDNALNENLQIANVTSWNNVENTGTMHAVAITTSAYGQLVAGDVIGVFNQNGIIAGMVQIDNLKNNAYISVYADNGFTTEAEGFNDGDLMTFKVYRNGEVIDATATFDASMPNTDIFNSEGLSAVTGLKLSATSINEVTSALNVQIFPNPAKNFVNIQTNFEIKSLKVVNYVGQVVFDRQVDQMNFQINTSNYGPGLYFVQIEAVDGNVITKRLTIN